MIIKTTPKLGLVGGTFDRLGGKSSYLVTKLSNALSTYFSVTTKNGGGFAELANFPVDKFSVLIWMPNVSNEEEKLLPNIKKLNPHVLLIQSKRVIEKQYDDFDIVKRLLSSHGNLCIKITKEEDYKFSVIDPLGNSWADNLGLEAMADKLAKRILFILSMDRAASIKVGERKSFEVEPRFLELVRYSGEQFSKLVKAVNPERFLGNASTRCMHGFPSVRLENSFLVSKRNVDKTIISSDQFVEVELADAWGGIKYYGDAKPSVDTPIQTELYRYYRNINYFIHGHVYVEGAPTTKHAIPCGFLQESKSITETLPHPTVASFSLNLKGHGCIIGAATLDLLETQLKYPMVGRPLPEKHDLEIRH